MTQRKYSRKKSSLSEKQLQLLQNGIDRKIEPKLSVKQQVPITVINKYYSAIKSSNLDEDNTFSDPNQIIDILNYMRWITHNSNKPYRFTNKETFIAYLCNIIFSLDKAVFLNNILPNIGEYMLTYRLKDAERVILYITNSLSIAIFYNRIVKIIPSETYGNLARYIKHQPGAAVTATIIDADYLASTNTYYVHDILMYYGNRLTQNPYSERLDTLSKVIINPTAAVPKLASKIKVAPFKTISVDTYKQTIKSLILDATEQGTDSIGIKVFNKNSKYIDTGYLAYTPVKYETITFHLLRHPYYPKDIHGNTAYILFNNITRKMFENLGFNLAMFPYYSDLFPEIDASALPNILPIPFYPSNNNQCHIYWSKNQNLDNTVCTFAKNNYSLVPEKPVNITATANSVAAFEKRNNADYNIWRLRNILEPFTLDNMQMYMYSTNYLVAEKIWFNICDPLNINTFEITNYFKPDDKKIHLQTKLFNTYVKAQLICKWTKNKDWVLDIASGKGQDLEKYQACGVKHGLFTDIDKTALIQFVYLKQQIANQQHAKSNHNPNNNNNPTHTPTYTLIHYMDLTQPYRANINQLKASYGNQLPNGGQAGFSAIVCNFAFHYMLDNVESVANVLKLINYYLASGGIFMFTAFDGASLNRLLSKSPRWEIGSGYSKYSIIKKYSGNRLEKYGQAVGVLLPFSRGEYYTEYLVNIDYLAKEFMTKFNIQLIKKGSFRDFLADYPNRSDMNQYDIEYASLYHYYVFKKL